MKEKEFFRVMSEVAKSQGGSSCIPPNKPKANKFTPIYALISFFILLGFTSWTVISLKLFWLGVGFLIVVIQWTTYWIFLFGKYLDKRIYDSFGARIDRLFRKWIMSIFGLIPYLKTHYPDKWKIILSIWIACFVFIIFAFSYHEMAYQEDDVFTQFIIITLSIAAILATVIYTINAKKKKMKEKENQHER